MPSLISNVAVLFGGPSPEHDVSVLTGLQVARCLQQDRRYGEVYAIFWSKMGAFHLVKGQPEAKDFADGLPPDAESLSLVCGDGGGFVARRGRISARLEQLAIDALVVCTHGGPGEDGSIQGALDLAGIAYTGPSLTGAALGMDKFAAGEVVRGAGIATLGREILTPDLEELPFPGPYIVKPRFGGSSIGIEVVADLETAIARLGANVHLRRGAVVEPYRGDLFDLQIAMCTFPELQLSAIERPIRTNASSEILNYEDKYVSGSGMDRAQRELPAVIPDSLATSIRAAARRCAEVLGVRGVARVDFLSDGERAYFNEINTIPGSLSRHLFVEPHIEFEKLLADLIAEAKERPTAHYSSTGATGALLRDAKSISAKLG